MKLAHPRSLEGRLLLNLSVLILTTGVLTAALGYVSAARDADEVLDGVLQQTTSLLLSRQVALPEGLAELPGTEKDNDVLVWRLPPVAGGLAARPATSHWQPGYQTIAWRGEDWRMLVTPLDAHHWIAVAQRMEERDEIARHSAQRALLPWLLLIPLLALLLRRVVKQGLAPVRRLAEHVDAYPIERAAQLPPADVPAEIEPFVSSIRQLVGELATTLEQQRHFVANAAHELRSPVAALSLQASNLEGVLVDPVARERMGRLGDGIHRIQALLEQLLSMARAQLDRRNADRRANLAEAVKRVLSEFVPLADDKGIDLGVDVLADEAEVLAAPLDIEVVLRNVVGNSLKFCPEASVVTLSVLVDGDDAVLRVCDNGPGMDDQALHAAFEPFVRGAQAREPGSGLGLSIVAAIARRLGARVALRPNPQGAGLVFEYRQPRCQRTSPPDAQAWPP